MPTILEIAQTIKDVDPKTGKRLKRTIDHGLTPEPLPEFEGLYSLTPAQILSVFIPTQSVNGTIEGYQRKPKAAHVADIAAAIRGGKVLPVGEIVRLPDGRVDGADCQHRLLASLMARTNLDVALREMTHDQARQMFHDQVAGKKVDKATIILSGDGPYERYCQDALTNTSNPWYSSVSKGGSSARIGIGTLYTMLGIYVGNKPIIDNAHESNEHMRKAAFDTDAAADLCRWVSAFGPKQKNPEAYVDINLRATASAALLVMRRREITQVERKRWAERVGQFPFHDYKKSTYNAGYMAREIVQWWNVRLPESRRVALPPMKNPKGK